MWNLKPNPLFDSRTIPIQLIIIDYIYGLGPSYTTQYFFNRMLILTNLPFNYIIFVYFLYLQNFKVIKYIYIYIYKWILRTFSIKIKVMDVPPNSKVQTEFLIIVALFLSSHYWANSEYVLNEFCCYLTSISES